MIEYIELELKAFAACGEVAARITRPQKNGVSIIEMAQEYDGNPYELGGYVTILTCRVTATEETPAGSYEAMAWAGEQLEAGALKELGKITVLTKKAEIYYKGEL